MGAPDSSRTRPPTFGIVPLASSNGVPGKRHAPVADTAKDDPAGDDLALVGRHRSHAPLAVGLEPVPDDLDAPPRARRRGWPPGTPGSGAAPFGASPVGSRAAKPRRISTFRWTMFEASASSASLAGSSSSSARIDEDVRAGELAHLLELRRRPGRLHRSAPPEDDDLADPGCRRSPRSPHPSCPSARAPRGVSASMRATSSATFPLPMTTARSSGEVEVELLEVGVAVVPGDELGGRPRAGQVLARNAETTVRLRADGIHHRVVELR